MNNSTIEYIVAAFINLFAINVLVYKIAVEKKNRQLQIINEYINKMYAYNSPEKLKQYEEVLDKLVRQVR
jgi:hypothetical protein